MKDKILLGIFIISVSIWWFLHKQLPQCVSCKETKVEVKATNNLGLPYEKEN